MHQKNWKSCKKDGFGVRQTPKCLSDALQHRFVSGFGGLRYCPVYERAGMRAASCAGQCDSSLVQGAIGGSKGEECRNIAKHRIHTPQHAPVDA